MPTGIAESSPPERLLTLVARTHRQLAVLAGLEAASAVVAMLGWIPLALVWLAVPAWAIGTAVVVGMTALVVASTSMARVRARDAARHLDRELAASGWTLFTAWELWHRRSAAGSFADALARQANATCGAQPAPAMPRWRSPIVALLAMAWLAIGTWLVVAGPPASSTADGASAELSDDLQRLREMADTRRDREAQRIEQALANAFQSPGMTGINETLRDLEAALGDRMRQHQRQSAVLRELEDAARDMADRDEPMTDEEWQQLLDRLTNSAQRAGADDVAAELDEARTTTLTDEQRRELLDRMIGQLDRDLADDRRMLDQLELVMTRARDEARDRHPDSITAESRAANRPPADPDANPDRDTPPATGVGSHSAGTNPNADPGDTPPEYRPEPIPLEARDPFDIEEDAPEPAEYLPARYLSLVRRHADWKSARDN